MKLYDYKSNKLSYNHTPAASKAKFVSLMAEKAILCGATDSSWQTPDGSPSNLSTAHDVVMIYKATVDYKAILDAWRNKTKTINVVSADGTVTTKTFTSSINNTPIGDYTVFGGKTGGWGVAPNYVGSLCVFAEVNSQKYVAAVMGCSTEASRFENMEIIFDNIKNGTTTPLSCTAGYAIRLENYPGALYHPENIEAVFSQAPTTKLNPASVTKNLTAMVALDLCDSLYDEIVFDATDIAVGGSGAVFHVGDRITLLDALYAIYMPSSNQAATAVARTYGAKALG